MSKKKILLVEDEMSLAMVVTDNLVEEGYEVHHALNGEDALKQFYQKEPDLVILDVMMPKVNGFTVAKTIRNTDRETPILFLTAKVQVKDVVKGFEAGGNDYIRKPFSIQELLVRMKVMLSDTRLLDKVSPSSDARFELGKFQFDSKSGLLAHSGQSKKLTSRESELLKLFCRHKDEVLTKESILLSIWGDDSFFNSRSLDVFVSKLRKYLEADSGVNIVNIRGVGYKLILDH